MKLSNKYGYPDAIVQAITNDDYDKGDCEYSATDLIRPPRIRALYNLHQDEMEMDVDDRIFLLYGHMGHALLDRADKSAITEKRYFGEIDGIRISAQVDSLSLSKGLLIDWKFTSVYGFKVGNPPKDEWTMQMNIQLELLRQNGLDAKQMQIWGLLRDWRPRESKGIGYPNKLGFHNIEMFPRARTQLLISNMIQNHKLAEKDLPLCSDSDRWAKKGEPWARCANYCEVAKYCKQYQEGKK